MRRWHASAWGTIAVGVLALSCGSPEAGGADTTTTGVVIDAPVSIAPAEPVVPAGPPGSRPTSIRTGANPPTITNFIAPPSVECTAGQPTVVPVTYQTSGAFTVGFADGPETVVGAPPVSGGYNVPVSCDGKAHTIVLMAIADDGSTSGEAKAVMVGGE